MAEYLFLGHNIAYWEELNRRAQELDAERLLVEIIELRGKLAFYEKRIKEMVAVMERSV